MLGAEVGRFDPAKALRILSTSKDYARQTLIQSAFMIRTGLLPVADCQSCFVCSQASRSALPSHLRPHASIHADPAMVSACRPSEFGFLRAHTGVLKPVAAPNESCVGPRYIFGSFLGWRFLVIPGDFGIHIASFPLFNEEFLLRIRRRSPRGCHACPCH